MRLLIDGAQTLGVSDEHSLRLQLIVEELFTNTVIHGFKGDTDNMVKLSLAMTPAGITLRYTDTAPAYDPTLRPSQNASHELLGGLGITLIQGMSQDFRYNRQDGRNVCDILL